MSEWISVKDKLPKFGKIVLTKSEFGRMEVAYYPEEKWDSSWRHHFSEARVENITHWMPLPKLAEER